jgi:hypothetical protein
MPALASPCKTAMHTLPWALTCQHVAVSDKVGDSGCSKGMAVHNDDAFQTIDASGSCLRPDDPGLCRVVILSLNWAAGSPGVDGE